MKSANPSSGGTSAAKMSALSLRGGYQMGLAVGQGGGFTYGLGYEQDYGGLFFTIDIVQVSYGYLGASNRASMSVHF